MGPCEGERPEELLPEQDLVAQAGWEGRSPPSPARELSPLGLGPHLTIAFPARAAGCDCPWSCLLSSYHLESPTNFLVNSF